MKRKLFLGLASLAIMAVAIVTVSSVNANSSDSDLLSANLEALTRDEGNPQWGKKAETRTEYVGYYNGTYVYLHTNVVPLQRADIMPAHPFCLTAKYHNT